MSKIMRNLFLAVGQNKQMTALAKKYGMRFGADRFVAGETLDDAVKTIAKLNEEGFSVTIDRLGEFVETEEETKEMAENCIKAIEEINERNLDGQISLKLTSLGIDMDRSLALENMRKILDAGKKYQTLVTIDAEDSGHSDATLDLFKELRKDYDNVGTVVQAYLYRTDNDLDDLDPYDPNIRIVKGAYNELENVAFVEKRDVDLNFKRLIRKHLLNGHFTAIGTHDDEIINYAKDLIREHYIPDTQYEFQMLYGICKDRQRALLKEGYPVRIYVPYGRDWYAYNMRRLAERPANVAFVLKGAFK